MWVARTTGGTPDVAPCLSLSNYYIVEIFEHRTYISRAYCWHSLLIGQRPEGWTYTSNLSPQMTSQWRPRVARTYFLIWTSEGHIVLRCKEDILPLSRGILSYALSRDCVLISSPICWSKQRATYVIHHRERLKHKNVFISPKRCLDNPCWLISEQR